MSWLDLVAPIGAAVAALLGVRYGARLTESREAIGWSRDQRLKAYADVLDAVDRCYAAFALIESSLQLANYQASAMKSSQMRTLLDEWGQWDQKIDEALPRAELVASQSVQPYLSVGIRHGTRTRHRVLLMQLDHLGSVDRREWKSVGRLTLEDMDRIRETLRTDLTRGDTAPRSLETSIVRARRSGRIIKSRIASR